MAVRGRNRLKIFIQAYNLSTLPQGEQKRDFVRSMFDRIAKRYDLLNAICTFGLDTRWRRKAVRSLGLKPGAQVADLACGTGDLIKELNLARLRPTGFDFSENMLRASQTPNTPMACADITQMPVPDNSFDGATMGFALRNVVSPKDFFFELARIIRPGAKAAILEIGTPSNKIIHFVHSFYFNKVVPLIGRLLSDKEAYQYLPESLAYLPTPAELRGLLAQAGFEELEIQSFTGGAAVLFVFSKPAKALAE